MALALLFFIIINFISNNISFISVAAVAVVVAAIAIVLAVVISQKRRNGLKVSLPEDLLEEREAVMGRLKRSARCYDLQALLKEAEKEAN